MKTFYIDPSTNDINFDGQNNIEMVDGDEELVQEVERVMTTYAREWFLDPTLGFDYATVQKKQYNQEEVIQAFYEAIQQVERVQKVESLDLDYDRKRRKLSIKFKVLKTNGGIVEGVI